MNVKELIEILQPFKGNEEVFIKTPASACVFDICNHAGIVSTDVSQGYILLDAYKDKEAC